MNEKHLISIIGPTAVGKTNLAIAISKHYKAPIISSDSRQFYKQMTIGTAVPTPTELAAAPHYFIQHKSIYEPYSVGDFEKEALAFLKNNYNTKDIAILVGGSGLYTNALCFGLDHFPKVPNTIREHLEKEFKSQGLMALQAQLKKIDPLSYNQIALDNPARVIRALAVSRASGKPFSSFLNQPKALRNFKIHTINITIPRDVLYERINTRVNTMMASGLEKEARGLYAYRELNALNTVGYKELFSYFDGEISLPKAIEEIKKNTRRFAKRQLTWNRKRTDAYQVSYLNAALEALSILEKRIK